MSLVDTANTLLHNPVFSGVVGGGAVASIFYALRAVPAHIAAFGQRWFTVTLTIKGTQGFYPVLNKWLTHNGYSDRATRLQLNSNVNRNEYLGTSIKEDDATFTMGFGNHFIWYKRRPVWVQRERSEKSNSRVVSAFSDETVTLTTIGRKQRIIREMIEEALSLELKVDNITISFWDEYSFEEASNKTKRSMESIFIPQDQKNRIIDDLNRFYNHKHIYNERGTPWRRGYLLRGVPGTGKSSLIFALASYFDKPVKIINLATVGGDTALMNAITAAGSDCFIVMEDIDSVGVTHDRDTVAERSELKDDQEKGALTLAGILNAIDGIASPEGRVLFLTSNHAEKLDSALLRPGRIDIDETICPLDEGLALEMTRRFRKDDAEVIYAQHVAEHVPLTAANLQNILLKLD